MFKRRGIKEDQIRIVIEIEMMMIMIVEIMDRYIVPNLTITITTIKKVITIQITITIKIIM